MSEKRKRVTVTQDELLAVQLGQHKMIGLVEKQAVRDTVRGALRGLEAAGIELGSSETEELLQGIVRARQSVHIERFIGNMAPLTGGTNAFARLKYRGELTVGVALIFGEGELLEAVSDAFDKSGVEGSWEDGDDDGDEEDEEFEDGEE